MAHTIEIQPPPRVTGDPRADSAATIEWVWEFYKATIVSGGVLQPSQLEDLLEQDFPTLHALGVLAGTGTNLLAYFTAPSTWGLTTLTAFARSLLDDVNQTQAQATIGVSPYTDEQAQDAVGGIVTDSTEIDFTYDDAAPSITGALKNNSVVVARLAMASTDRLVGRSTAGAGAGEEITCTAAGRAILDDVDAAAQRTTLGLGTFATQSADLTIIPRVPEYTVGTVPSAVANKRGIIMVSDETGGYTQAFSDGTNWRRVQDRAIVS